MSKAVGWLRSFPENYTVALAVEDGHEETHPIGNVKKGRGKLCIRSSALSEEQ